jgi:hypothetical protein
MLSVLLEKTVSGLAKAAELRICSLRPTVGVQSVKYADRFRQTHALVTPADNDQHVATRDGPVRLSHAGTPV